MMHLIGKNNFSGKIQLRSVFFGKYLDFRIEYCIATISVIPLIHTFQLVACHIQKNIENNGNTYPLLHNFKLPLLFIVASLLFHCRVYRFEPDIALHSSQNKPVNSGKKVINPFPNKPCFLRVCSTCILKTLREKEKLLVTSNFSFPHGVFYPFGELCIIFIKFKIGVCKLFQFERV